jgi:hypothetical protein
MSRFIGRLLISSGAAVCIGGAAGFWSLQASLTGDGLWPLPALALLDWGILGFAGFLSANADGSPNPGWGTAAPWAIGGALLPLGAISALSIGPFVLLSAILFLAGAAWEVRRRSKITAQVLKWLAGGLVANAALIFVIITLA